MNSNTDVRNLTSVDEIKDIAMQEAASTEAGLLTLYGSHIPNSHSNGEDDDESEDEDDESGDDESDDDDDSDCSYSSSSCDEEHETAMASREFSNMTTTISMTRNLSSPSLVQHELSSVQINIMLNQVTRRGSMSHASVTAPVGRAKSVVYIKGEGMEPSAKIHDEKQDCNDPTSHFNEILTNAGYTPRVFAYDETVDFFQEITESRVSSYSTDLIAAVKTGNVDHLRSLHAINKSRNMNSCNRFGESILHTACRHGQLEVVQFLLNEAHVDPRVCDDFGRTPCHDCAWQADPNVALMEMMATLCPDLLLISDKRGFTPLQYVRKPQWSAWVEMLEANKEAILPKQLLIAKPATEITSQANTDCNF